MLKHIVCIALLFFSTSLWATTEELVVQNIAVDVTGESAVEAQEQAFATAELSAFESLMQKMVAPQDLAKVPAPTPEQLKSFIASFSVQDEKRSDVRYMANLQYRFNSDRIRNFLQTHKILFSEKLVHPILIVPFLDPSHEEDTRDLWGKAWQKIDLKPYSLSFVTAHPTTVPETFPMGNTATGEPLRILGQKHKASHVAVIRMRTETPETLDTEESSQCYLDLYPSSLGQPDHKIETSMPFLKDMNLEKLIEAIHKGLREIEQFHLADTQETKSGPKETMELLVPTNTMDQWHKNLQMLKGISGLLVQNVKSISKSTAHVMVQISDIHSVTQQLVQKGFHVEPYHGYLILRMPHDTKPA